jgi:hypothetical protein
MWTGHWYYDCYLYQPWHGKSGEVKTPFHAWSEEEARSKVCGIGRRILESMGCPPMLITYHLQATVKKEEKR